jgi:hypothetical protein
MDKWTAIWSPSKSALNAVQTGHNWLLFLQLILVGKLVPSLCKVGHDSVKSVSFKHFQGYPKLQALSCLLFFFSWFYCFYNSSFYQFTDTKACTIQLPYLWDTTFNNFNSGPTTIPNEQNNLRFPSKFWRKRPCLPRESDNDFNGLFDSVLQQMLFLVYQIMNLQIQHTFSFLKITSGAFISINLFKRLLRILHDGINHLNLKLQNTINQVAQADVIQE